MPTTPRRSSGQLLGLPAGPDAADTIAQVRRYLADDLDTPKAIAALDGWANDALEYGTMTPGRRQLGVRL